MKCRLCSRHPLHSGLVQSLGTFYDIRTGNGAGLFSKEKITEGGISKDKVKKKGISGEAYDVNEQTIYIAPKSKIESRGALCPGAHTWTEQNENSAA